jgi:cytochrome c oxidase subunit 4
MNETHAAEPHPEGGHAGPGLRLYLAVAVALGVFTLASFAVNQLVARKVFEPHVGFTVILGVAVCKAFLVGAFFMHLSFDWRKLYFLLVPAALLAAVLVVGLLPDMVIAWLREPPGLP